MLAFLSYQTSEKIIAGNIQNILSRFGIKSFMAHEDIDISVEWQDEILKNIKNADIFIALLSKAYLGSVFCVQESGMAVLREDVLRIIPISLDGTVSPGFMGHIQSRVVKGGDYKKLLLSAISLYKPEIIIGFLTRDLENSTDFRGAEARFAVLKEYLHLATDPEILKILNISFKNAQISHASLCARNYLPSLLASHGHLMAEADQEALADRIAEYHQ